MDFFGVMDSRGEEVHDADASRKATGCAGRGAQGSAASNQAAHSLAARRRRSLASERGAERGRSPPTAGAGSGLGGGVSAWWNAARFGNWLSKGLTLT
jgi:hypothetical protein